MEKFRPLSEKKIAERESEITKYWDEIDLLERSVSTREGKESFIFYDGPPTANGKPGIHHVISRALKDSVCRYKTMQGYQVKRKAGWDTHGLPVEIEVEKQLKISGKQDIEKYGIKEFNEKCRESVFSYEKQWREMSEKMAYLIDMDNPYITLDNNYIETEWWILDKMFKDNMIYEGHKIIPYCSRCGTGLASHEVAQGYKEIKTTTVFVKFKRVGFENEFFLVWTTTPWTLPSNVALTVNPKETYVKAKVGEEYYYIEKNLAGKIITEEFEVVQEMLGKDMEYMEYEQLMPFVNPDKKAFFVTCADYVTTEDGTGIVHTAPAFGEDDYQTGRRYDLPVVQPVDEQGKFIDTPWVGQFVMDADPEVVKWLAIEGKLYRKEKMDHNYPHCWRCKTPLLYYAKPSWYIEVTKMKDLLIANNNSVEWYPDYVGEKRFGNWLENLNDWALSRTRYWGTPLNIWRCECGHLDTVGSRQELVDRAIEDIDLTIELHRPYVDDVHLACPHCGKPMTRVKDVIDCWFDSGSMPFAQHHYPFENAENFDQLFPADYICEGIDQTRGWFYSLLAISTYVKGISPYKRVLVNGHLVDKDGKKMSKSLGNAVDPFEMMDKFGADALRWYMLAGSPAWNTTKFDVEGLKEVLSRFIMTLKNVYTFFSLYANTDKVDPSQFFVEVADRPELDRWVISKFNNLVKEVREELDVYDLTKAVRKIQHFVSEDLSNWYIRRSRRRFWETELNEDKKAVYNTTYEILVGISKMIAPFAPFLAEDLFRSLTEGESVHLETYPEYHETEVDNALEERMDLVRDLVALGRGARELVRIKVRQPIQKVLVDAKYEALISYLVPLIQEELNVKEVVFTSELHGYMNFVLKPNFKNAGPVLGPRIKMFGTALQNIDAAKYAPAMERGETHEIEFHGETFTINNEMVLTSITAKEGFTVGMENNLFIILDTKLSQDLVNEGYAREFISKVQQMRKAANLEMMDRIAINYEGGDEIATAVGAHEEYIKQETLADEVNRVSGSSMEKQDLNGHETGMEVVKR